MKPSARDLVERARSTKGKTFRRDESIALLAEAETLADSANDWVLIAEGWANLRDADAARRCIERALASPTNRDTFTDAAEILKHKLRDPNEARAVLARCASYLTTARRRDWNGLARACVRILGDRALARSCLELATEHGTEADDLLNIAGTYVELLDDRERARSLVPRADAVATPHEWERLANAHRDLCGDATRAREIVDAALERADSVYECVSIARYAVNSKRDDAAALEHAALAKAEAIATTAAHWLDITAHYDRLLRPPEELRRCLQRALDVDVDGTARRRIAHAYRQRANDHAMAASLAPAALAPVDVVVKRHVLHGWVSEPARFLDWARPQLDGNALDDIAGRGGETTDYEKDVAVIREIQRTGLVPYPLDWNPRESFEWQQWDKGASVNPLRRAFACAVLLIDTAGPEYRDGWESTVAFFIQSCRELGDEGLAGATGLLVALAESMEPGMPELVFALFGLLLAAAARDPRDARLPALCDRLLTLVPDCHRRFASTSTSSEWLFGLTPFDGGHSVFRSIATEVLVGEPHLAAFASHLAPK